MATSVSRASVGNCSADGSYFNEFGNAQAFVVNERNGTWGIAQKVAAALSSATRGNTQVRSVSCAAAGNSSAGGDPLRLTGMSGILMGTYARPMRRLGNRLGCRGAGR
jgi:hypothetical protein